jgi:hypothetical protein
MLSASPLAWAQTAQGDAGKIAPAAAVAPDTKKAVHEPTDAERFKQQSRKECDAAAGEKKGGERKKFMVACLKDKKKMQEDQQKACNKEATDKKLSKSERRAFMKDCLFPKS